MFWKLRAMPSAARFGAGTSAAVANGFGPDSPYNADLPYDIKQSAIFGEASYDFGQIKLTGGGRYYSFKENRDFVSGGLFSNGDVLLNEKTKSNGFSPRAIVTWEPSRNLSLNLQAAKGFRLGGVNDPLNLPLCSDADEAIFGPFAGEVYRAPISYPFREPAEITGGQAAARAIDVIEKQVGADNLACVVI